MPRHAYRQGFEPLEEIEGRLRCHAGAEVTQALGARAHDEGGRAEFLGKIETVISGIGLGHAREFTRGFPVESAAVDQHAANRDPVSADPFGGRMEDNINTMFEC